MKIAIFHELPRGGARRAMNEFAFHLKKNNLVDLYFVDEKENIQEKNFYSKINFYKFIAKNWIGHNWKVRLYKDTVELIKLYFLNRKIARKIDSKKYDVVLVSASKFIEAPFIMKFLKTPFAFFIHDPYYRIIYDPMLKVSKKLDFFKYNYERINRFIRKNLDIQNINNAKLCLVPSKFIAQIFTNTYKKKCKIISYGVNVDLFKPADLKKEFDVFYIGSSDPIDGYGLVKEIAKNIMYRKKKIKVVLTDKEWISKDAELVNLYQNSKIFLATAYNEGLGLSPLEAMACGVPVIATNEAGHLETVVDNETGYLLDRNSRIFARKIDQLLSNPKELSRLSKNSRNNMIKHWNWDVQAHKLENILKEHLLKTK